MKNKIKILVFVNMFLLLFCFGNSTYAHADTVPQKTEIVLDVSAIDTMSGVDKMMLSNSADFKGSVWEPYAKEKDWVINSTSGVNYVYIKVMDKYGNVSNPYKMTVDLGSTKILTVVVATKNDFADAYAGEVLAKKLGGQVVRINNNNTEIQNTVSYITKNLSKKDKVYILGMYKAINNSLEKSLKSKGYNNIVRIGGADKYETAKKITENLKPKAGTPIVLVSGEKLPANSEAYKKVIANKAYPILFVKKNTLTKYTQQAIGNIKPSKVYIVGDKNQVTQNVINELKSKLKIKAANIIRVSSINDIK